MRRIAVCFLTSLSWISIGNVSGEVDAAQTATAPSLAQIDAVAVKTLCDWNQLSVRFDREFAGHLCWHQQRGLSVSPPRMGSPDTVQNPSLCAPDENPVGQYHTHGRYSNDGPSGVDVDAADRYPIPDFPFYVATPLNRIHRYQGPNARNRQMIIGSCQQ